MSEGWHAAYVAVSVALGDSVDAALASVGNAAGDARLPPRAALLADTLRSGPREVRVRALAEALADVALGVEAMGWS